MFFRLMMAALIVPGVLAGFARAELMITVGSGTVTSGGTGTVDVFISSDAAATLSAFSAEFLITRTSGTSLLRFQEPQPSPQFEVWSYIFYGVSDAQNLGQEAFVIKQPETNTPQDTVSGGDSAVTMVPGVPLPIWPDQALLARLTFTAPFGAAPGDTFAVALVSSDNSIFYKDFVDFVELAYTSSPGTVVVTEVPVPEPGSLTLLGLGAVAVACSWRPGKSGVRRPRPLGGGGDNGRRCTRGCSPGAGGGAAG